MQEDQSSLWTLGGMFAAFLAWIALCFLMLPKVVGDQITHSLGSPVFVVAASLLLYGSGMAIAFRFPAGRALWSTFGKTSQRGAVVFPFVIGALLVVIGLILRSTSH